MFTVGNDLGNIFKVCMEFGCFASVCVCVCEMLLSNSLLSSLTTSPPFIR